TTWKLPFCMTGPRPLDGAARWYDGMLLGDLPQLRSPAPGMPGPSPVIPAGPRAATLHCTLGRMASARQAQVVAQLRAAAAVATAGGHMHRIAQHGGLGAMAPARQRRQRVPAAAGRVVGL